VTSVLVSCKIISTNDLLLNIISLYQKMFVVFVDMFEACIVKRMLVNECTVAAGMVGGEVAVV